MHASGCILSKTVAFHPTCSSYERMCRKGCCMTFEVIKRIQLPPRSLRLVTPVALLLESSVEPT